VLGRGGQSWGRLGLRGGLVAVLAYSDVGLIEQLVFQVFNAVYSRQILRL
jgi:hypothetical protein